ncbi:GtrA family protein [Microbulbifer sp. ALW1]|uniref:GtrA family protein n=1 Tax=Microbulbifer sp. (strain ALW1) TaxID=1516059 RepID=UPI001356BE56|nr:GtrA family protein [Microbulbifer sp. ALW1]
MRLPDTPAFLKPLLGRAGRFAAVGGVATGVQYLLLVALVEFIGVAEVPSSVLAFLLSAAVNYWLNFYLTFAGRARHREALPRFVLVAVIGLAMNTLIFSLTLSILPYLLAQVCATLVTLIGNFLLHQFWIYREPQWNS